MTTTDHLRDRAPLRALAFALAFALALAACGGGDGGDGGRGPRGTAEPGDTLRTIAPGRLTVCSDIPYAPFEYEENGRVVGIDADIMRAIGGRLGLSVEFRDTDFDGIFAALQAGQCDVIASSVSITDERKQRVDFSEGYFEIVQSLLVRKADASRYADLPMLRGRTIGVQSGTTGAAFAAREAPAAGVQVREFTGADDLLSALRSGQVDAVLQDYPVNAYHAKTTGETVVSKRFESQKEQYGIVIPKGRADLKKAIDDALARIRSDDTYPTIIEQYIGERSGSD